MKIRRRITSVIIIVVLVALVAFRLISNKRSFSNQLQMVSELNTTIPIFTDTVRYKQIKNGFSTNGTFTPFQEISIASEAQGKISTINAETGDNVKKGQVLATIDNEISASQLSLAKFNLDKAEKDLKRFEQLSQGDAATVQQYETVKQVFINADFAYTSAKVQNDNTFIKAPFNGFITKRYIEKGTFITPGAPVFDIVDIDKVKIIAKLTITEASKVIKGQNAEVTVNAYPGVNYTGIVSNIVIKADLSKRYDVEVDVINHSDNILKPGMYGTVLFESDSSAPVLVIPRRAIANSIMNPEVFLVKGDSVSTKSIVVEVIDDKYVVVKSGLSEGDVIVTSGQINLVNGSKIRVNN
jgi:membrane fusion protein, multidrug efflux system